MRKIAAVLAASAFACSQGHTADADQASQSTQLTLLTPISVESEGGGALLDRDTTTSMALTGSTRLVLNFAQDVSISRVKLFGGEGVAVTVQGAAPIGFGAKDRWEAGSVTSTAKQRRWTVMLRSTGAEAHPAELELWGTGVASAPRDPAKLAAMTKGTGTLPYLDTLVLRPAQDSAALSLDAQPCATFSFSTTVAPGAIHRAWLVYEAAGVQRPFVLGRSVNGAAAQGGVWLGGGDAEHTVIDELDPARLTGNDSTQLCVPAEATQTVFVAGARLILELDDGHNLLDRDAQRRAGAAFDGDPATSATVSGPLALDRVTVLDGAGLSASAPARARSAAAEIPLSTGWNELPFPGAGATALDLTVDNPVAELALSGSPSGANVKGPRIVVTTHLRADGARDVGERFGNRAYVAGWAESPAGPGEVTIEGAPASLGGGAFASAVTRDAQSDPSSSWHVTISARFPDGTTATRTVDFDDDISAEIAADRPDSAPVDEASRFGNEEELAQGDIDAKGGSVHLGTEVAFDAPAGAVPSKTTIGITHKAREDVPPLDAGMINVTAPRGAGYKFTPEGQKFGAAVAITLPYDASLLPAGTTVDQIQAFFYDEPNERWQSLPRRQLDRAHGRLVSETTHFTFMINAVLVTPDHPGPASFNPTSIKDLKAAEPSAGIDFIEPPQANSQGTAQVALPIRLPAARGAYHPALAFTYDSQAANGWLGVGWDVNASTITVDTKFGVPYYDGTERYVLDGAQLVPVGNGTCVDGTTGRQYAARSEGAFDLIVRCGADSTSYRWERTDKSGVLFLYGLSAEARVASPRTGDIAVWHVERVIDPNGNLTRYVYEQDQKRDPGTPFDRNTFEDFRQSYLTHVIYSGHAARTGSAALSTAPDTDPGIYSVAFLREGDDQGPADRPDPVISGRTGFKVVTRHRLARVQVWLVAGPSEQRGIIREYALQYELGDFGKSRIKCIDVYGAGGVSGRRKFTTHGFGYTSAPGGFSAPVPWSFDASDGNAISTTEESFQSERGFVGISAGPSRSSGSVGVNVAHGHRDAETHAMLIDLNGDGLPDRVTSQNGVLTVQLNQGAGARQLSSRAPAGDPLAGGMLMPFASPIPSLGKESGDNLNFGVQGVFGIFSANVGASYNSTKSTEFIMDADGDGLPDFVGDGQVLFNYPRTCTGAGCCPKGQFCFGSEKPVGGAVSLANVSASNAGSATLEAARQALADNTPPNDALLEWTAPYAGIVDVTGAMSWLHGAPEPGKDGVRLRIYQAHADGSMDAVDHPVYEAVRLPADIAATPVAAAGLQVAANDHLYFVVSTLKDFPVRGDAATPVALEEVGFSPVIQYQCSGSCTPVDDSDPLYRDATGAPAYRFERGADFRPAGGPLTILHAQFSGTVHVEGAVRKLAATSDDVRACVQIAPASEQLAMRSCDGSAAALLQLSSTQTGEFAFTSDVDVEAGEQILFRIDSDLSIDPGAINWTPHGSVTSICENGSCRAPNDFEAQTMGFDAQPYAQVHSNGTGERPLAFIAPVNGTLEVLSRAGTFALAPITYAVRSPNELFMKHGAGQVGAASIKMKAGDVVYIEAHAERDPLFWPWDLSARFNGLDVSGFAQRTFESSFVSPFGGGFHGFRYGTWSGRDGQGPFDASMFYRSATLDLGGGDSHDQFLQGKQQARDPNSSLSQRSRLFGPMMPRTVATASDRAGLAPPVAFVSHDGTAFATAESMHGGKRGGYSRGGGSVEAMFGVGDLSRGSAGQTVSAGLGVSLGVSASVNLSWGSNTQQTDVRDLNGDGIIDVAVDGSGVRLTDPASLGPRAVPARLTTSAPFALHHTSDVSISAGLGYSEPFHIVKAGGTPVGQTAMYPDANVVIGGGIGIGATMSQTETDLVDVNGDGLPDQVHVDSNGQLRVRLNLGTSFAENEDVLAGASWSSAAGFDPFAQRVSSGIEPGRDDEEQTGQQDASSSLLKLGTPNVVRRTTAVTLEGSGSANAQIVTGPPVKGFVYEEEFGATANYESSLNTTSVTLVDVTGDGLPDYVRKAPGDAAFYVKVNTGFGFLPEQQWPVAAWPVQKPYLRLPGAAVDSLLGDLGIRDGGEDPIEASAINSAQPSTGFSASVTIPLTIALTPWLILSTGADFSPQKVSGFELSLMDIDGDGVPDHVLKIQGGGKESKEAVYARINQSGGGNLLSHVDEPLGGSFDVAYVRQGNTVEMPESRWVMNKVAVHDGLETGAGHDLVSTVEYDGGHHDRGEREFFGFSTVRTLRQDGSTLVHRYRNDAYRGKGLLLSEELRDGNQQLFTATINVYDADPQLVAPGADECVAATPFFLSPDDWCSAAWVRLLRTEHRFYEGQTQDVDQPRITTAQTFSYDPANGNVIGFEDLGDVADSADDLNASVDYSADGSALHVLDRPSHVVVYAGRASRRGAVLRERSGSYDAAGNLKEQVVTLGGAASAVSDLDWNDDGQLRTFTGPANARGQRYAVTYSYDSVARQYVTGTVDSFGYASSAEYDLRFGDAIRTIDVNGQLEVHRYDPFGRLDALWGPYDPPGGAPTVKVSYAHGAHPAFALTANRLPYPKLDGSTTLDNVVFMDGFRRVVQTRADAEVRGVLGATASGRVDYDVMGRVASQGQVTFSTTPKTQYLATAAQFPTTFVHDVLGRNVLVVQPDASTTVTEYGFGKASGDPVLRFRTSVTDAEAHVHVSYQDGAQRVSAVEERIQGRVPTTRYLYDPVSQLQTVIDAAGNRTEVRYDLGGRTISLTSPDSGLTEYTYDPAGNLVTKVDPNLRAARLALGYQYDFNRLTRVQRPISGDVTFEYGPPGAAENAAGRITRVVDEAGTETRGYGALGELVRTTRTVVPLQPGNAAHTYETKFQYDSFGRMLQIVYPDGELLAYRYDGGGLVTAASSVRPDGTHERYLSSIQYDEFGQRVLVQLGNGVVSRYTYDPRTRRLSGLNTITPLQRTLQANSYAYDRVGNVLGIENGLPPSTHQRSGPISLRYQYDELDRLIGAQGVADSRPGFLDRFTSSYAYDDIHNLTRNTQVHELVNGPGNGHLPPHSNYDLDYAYNGAGPHQASRIGKDKITYDASGNTFIQCNAGQGICAGTAQDNGKVPASHDHWRRYDWTEESWMRQAVTGGGQDTTRFLYDGSGQRVVKFGRGTPEVTIGQFFTVQSGHHATKHVFVGAERIASKLIPVADEVHAFPAVLTSVCRGASCAQVQSGGTDTGGTLQQETYYYHPDHLGSTSWMTDHEGYVHEHVEYYPYGEVWRDSQMDEDPGPSPRTPQYLFTSKEYDPETRLYYYGARYYDARVARWTAPDPALATHHSPPVLASAYLYSNGSPVRYFDPDGRVAYDADKRRWVLQPGDTIARVARQTGFSVHQIMAAGHNKGIDWHHVTGSEIVSIPQTKRIRTFEEAAQSVGSRAWAYNKAKGAFPANTNKCNLFVCEMAEAAGARAPRYAAKPHWPYLAGTMGQDKELPALSRVRAGDEKIGDIAAIPHRYSDASGHALIYAGDVDIFKGGLNLREGGATGEPALPGEPAFISAHEYSVALNPLSHYRAPGNPLHNDPIVYHRVKE